MAKKILINNKYICSLTKKDENEYNQLKADLNNKLLNADKNFNEFLQQLINRGKKVQIDLIENYHEEVNNLSKIQILE